MSRYLILYPLLGVTSFALALLLTWLMIRLGPRLGLVDEPGEVKFHQRVTPLGGGVAMYLALLPVLFVPALQSPRTAVVVLAAGVALVIGLVDDLRHVPATVKFALLVAMTALLGHFGIAARTTQVAALDLLITILWVTGVTSALNAIDNIDGLAGGVSAIASAAFLVIACQTGQWVLGGLSVALLGASLGFLVFNFAPARIFMGDSGSFFLGFLLASLGVVGEWNPNRLIAAVIPVLVLALPVFDLSFTVLRRHLTGVTRTPVEAIRHCGTDHLSHRLVRLGLGPRQAVLLLYLVAASFGLSAIALRDAASAQGLLHLLQALVITAALIPILCLGEPRRAAAVPGAASEDGTPGRAA